MVSSGTNLDEVVRNAELARRGPNDEDEDTLRDRFMMNCKFVVDDRNYPSSSEGSTGSGDIGWANADNVDHGHVDDDSDAKFDSPGAEIGEAKPTDDAGIGGAAGAPI